MIDAVMTVHTNPQTCGVAKFNYELARRLGVPCVRLDAVVRHPLVSVKPSELYPVWTNAKTVEPLTPYRGRQYDVLLHGPAPQSKHWQRWLKKARRVFYADELGCPSTITGNPHRGAYRVLVFGMAHKLNLPHFERLKEQLDREHPDYTIELSTAVHEGNPWDKNLRDSVEAMRGIFGARLRVLGYLGDDALAKELGDVDAVACFYQPALRANNTTYWAAVEAGKTIYTNRDDRSPQEGDPPPTWDRLIEVLRG